MNMIPTSEGTLLSTIHGRDRRALRSIGKKDLLAAKKYGTRERQYYRDRWKFTFAGIVYITESDQSTEVTSYALPIEVHPVALTLQDHFYHNELARKMKAMPSICTSHIVVVIDQSSSMRTCDVDNYKTRSDAVYATMALDYLGKQIDQRHFSNANYTDAMTLIEMHEYSSIIFEREPCTNVLYNKFVDRKSSVKPSGHGMFLDALYSAGRALRPDKGNDSCTLMIMFLSDGKPSDHIPNPANEIGQMVFKICSEFGPQLSVHTLGFAQRGSDFTVLEHMAEQARNAGCKGNFELVDTRGNALSASITSLSDSMSATRKMSMMSHELKASKTTRNISAESLHEASDRFSSAHDDIYDGSWTFYQDGYNRLTWSSNKQQLTPVGAGQGVCIRNIMIGAGAERLVFRAVELVKNSEGQLVPAPEKLVAKECKYEEGLKLESFHEIFCKTQRQASKLADKFNKRVTQMCHLHSIPVPATIQFLQCYVYEVPEQIGEEVSYRTVLIEKRLDPNQYTKWNSNNGYVAGPQKLSDILNRQLIEPVNIPRHEHLEVIEEGSDCSEDEIDASSEKMQICEEMDPSNAWKSSEEKVFCILPTDVPQAFSHHSYRYTQRAQLVCDLQGVLDTSISPPVFELTDPVIHTNDHSRQRIFGRTDHGHKGMRSFMKSHICNDLCKLLGISEYH